MLLSTVRSQISPRGRTRKPRAYRCGHTGGLDVQVLAGFQCLGVQIPGNFHMVADKAKGNDDHTADARGRSPQGGH